MPKWKPISDKNIRSLWICPECKKKAHIEPNWYQDNGTPVCECDLDMKYSHTEIEGIEG